MTRSTAVPRHTPSPSRTAHPTSPAWTKPVENADIARMFREVADLLEIEGENAFRIRAYRNAARVVEESAEPSP